MCMLCDDEKAYQAYMDYLDAMERQGKAADPERAMDAALDAVTQNAKVEDNALSTHYVTSTADLKFLHDPPRLHSQELQIESGTSNNDLPIPFGFRSSSNASAATTDELRKPGIGVAPVRAPKNPFSCDPVDE